MNNDKRIKWLVKSISEAKDKYYNSGEEFVPDPVFDAWEEELKRLQPAHPILRQVGAPLRRNRDKVKLPYYLGSLDKIKTHSSAREWLLSHCGDTLVSDKLDGVSMLLIYENHVPVNIYKRGTSETAESLAFILPYLNIPKRVPMKTLAVRGELLISKDIFEAYYKKVFVNPRAMVAGIVNRVTLHPALIKGHAKFITYQILNPFVSPYEDLKTLKSLGFNIVKHKVLSNLNFKKLEILQLKRKELSDFDIDGLVLCAAAAKQNYFDNAISFKSPKAMDGAIAKVKMIHWNLSKDGYYKPTLEIYPTNISQVTVTSATCFNAKFIVDNNLGPGAKIYIIRSGDVIPYISSIVKSAPEPQLPIGRYVWNESGVDLMLPTHLHSTNAAIQVEKINRFFSFIGAEFLGQTTIQKFYSKGYKTVESILLANPEDWKILLGPNMAFKVKDSIDEALSRATLPVLMSATTFFGRGFAYERAVAITEQYPDILKDFKKGRRILPKLLRVSSIGGKLAPKIVEGFGPFVAFMKAANIIPALPQKFGTEMSGMVVAFTGFRNSVWEEKIVNLGGKLSNGVTKQTTVLVTKDADLSSKKVLSAQAKGIKIYSMEEFSKFM